MRQHVFSATRPQDIEITPTSVFIAENITPYERTIDGYTMSGYEYDYIIYTKDEYIAYLAEQNKTLEEELRATKIILGVE